MKAPMSLMPAVPVAAGLMCGIVLQNYTVSLWWPVSVAAAAAFLYVLRQHVFAFVFMSVCVGWMLAASAVPAAAPAEAYGEACDVRGVVTGVRDGRASQTLYMEIDAISPDGSGELQQCRSFKAVGSVVGFDKAYFPGDTVYARCVMQPVPLPYYSPVQSVADRKLFQDGITARISYMEVLYVGEIGRLRSVDLRSDLIQKIAASGLSDGAAALIQALILGDGSALPQDVRGSYRASGLAHVLALSGLHIGVILLILSAVMLPLRFFACRNIYAVMVVCALWAYALFTGMSVSVTRAVVMASVLIFARALGRRYSPVNSLAVAAIVILAVRPVSLFDIGFQLSFTAVLAIILLAGPLNVFRNSGNRWLAGAGFAVSTTIAATLGTFVVSSYWFGVFPLYFLPGNLVVMWLMPWLVGCGAVYVLLLGFGCELSWLGAAVEWLCLAMNTLAEYISSLPGASVDIRFGGSLWSIVVYFICLAGLVYMLRKGKKIYAACIVMFAVVLSVVAVNCIPRDTSCSAYVIDAISAPRLLVAGPDSCRLFMAEVYEDQVASSAGIGKILHERGLDSVRMIQANGIEIGDRYVFIVNSKHSLFSSKVDYALVGGSYSASPLHVLDSVRPDTVVLSAALSPEKRRRWFEFCDARSVPVIDLRRRDIHFIF